MTNGQDRPRKDVEFAFAHLMRPKYGPEVRGRDRLASERAAINDYGAVDASKLLTGVNVVPVKAGTVPAEYIVPANCTSLARVVYFHGGGWMLGGLQSHRPLAAVLAKLSGMPVLTVDYRLAPEHIFPAGLEDCETALRWAAANGPLGPQPASDIHLAGDSAGGNLAAAACIQDITGKGVVPSSLVLLSPVLDAAPNETFVARRDPLISNQALQGLISVYAKGHDVADPRISPMAAPDDILRQFPPTLIQVSNDEFVRHSAGRFADRLADAGSRAVLSTWPLMPHVWHMFLDRLPEAMQALIEAAQFLRANSYAESAEKIDVTLAAKGESAARRAP